MFLGFGYWALLLGFLGFGIFSVGAQVSRFCDCEFWFLDFQNWGFWVLGSQNCSAPHPYSIPIHPVGVSIIISDGTAVNFSFASASASLSLPSTASASILLPSF